MKSFDLPKVSQITGAFITNNKRLGYSLDKVEEDGRHVLYQAANLFSLLYCQITTDLDVVESWPDLQETLFKHEHREANRYLIYVVPDSLIKQSHLYEDLARAERDDRFFRKVFIGLPDSAGKRQIENSLADRIPLWFEEKDVVLRQYVPVLSEVIPDRDLLKLLLQSTPSAVVKAIEKQEHYAYLLNGTSSLPGVLTGVQESTQLPGASRRGLRVTGLTVQDFRRFKQRSFDLDGDVVLIYGRNGTGKTTICDALELSIFPHLRRLQGDPDIRKKTDQIYAPFIRAGSSSERAYISVSGIDGEEGFSLDTTVTPQGTVKSLKGKSATHEDVVRFLTRNENADKEQFLTILLHTHFLGQHSIRDFIYGNRLDDDDKITTTRYNLLAEMFGFGEVENLKKRLTKVLSQIKRSKISEAEHQIEAVRTQMRGLKQKYGPKSRHDLEKKGYQIIPEAAIQKYNQLRDRLTEPLGPDLVRQVSVVDVSLEEYQASCESIRELLTGQVRSLEAHGADLKKIGRLLTKISAMFPEVSILNAVSTMALVEQLQKGIHKSIETVERARREVQNISVQIESLSSDIARLQLFSETHERYLELLATERTEVEALNSIQKDKNNLLQQQSDILLRLKQASMAEQNAAKLLRQMEERKLKYELVRASLGEAKAAKRVLEQQTSRLADVDAAIAHAEQRLSQMDEQVLLSQDEASLQESFFELESLRTNALYTCPCCGAEYDERQEFEQRIKNQLTKSKYPKELRAFLLGLERRDSETVRGHLEEIIRSHRLEKIELERTVKAKRKILRTFQALVSELGETGALSEADLRETMQKLDQEVGAMQQALASHEAVSLRVDSAKTQDALASLRDDSHKEHLEEIRREILGLVGPLSSTLQADELQSAEKIKNKKDSLAVELLDCAARREVLLDEIKANEIPEERLQEADECIGDLQSLSMGQDDLRNAVQGSAPGLVDKNLTKQRICHELLTEVEELSKLFGLLSAQDRSDTLTLAIEGYETEKHRWTECYRSVERINTDLSKLTSSGLEKSLVEYGPLINQIYQKFIRHDIFAALVLDPSMSRKGNRRDLYLRLRSYSGESKYTPASYLSEAQLNILALSIFLTRVMYQNISELGTVFIDDPIQQMDDMNSAAFVDVILGLSQIGKQIIITTCNHDFYRLVAHKMQSVSSTGRVSFKAVDLDSGAAV